MVVRFGQESVFSKPPSFLLPTVPGNNLLHLEQPCVAACPKEGKLISFIVSK